MRGTVDPLAGFRERFVAGDQDVIYMDGNSLGPLPKSAAARIREVVEHEWGRDLVRSWDRWLGLAGKIGDEIAAHVVGARTGEVIVSDSTTVNLYKLCAAGLDARPGRRVVISDEGNFPSDLYVLQALCNQRGLELRLLKDPEALEEAPGGDTALVTFSHVNYRSSYRAPLPRITQLAHEAGALMLWDLSHAAGATPVDLAEHGADLAVGCTYKYLSGGPGSPAFLYVRKDLQEQLEQPVWGWFGQENQFGFRADYRPSAGIGRFLVGTPPVASLAGIEAGVGLVREAGIAAIRERSVAITEMMIEQFDEWPAGLGFELGTPRDADRRGSHLAFVHPDAERLCRLLIEKAGVIPDFRPPDVIRYGVSPLYTTFEEAGEAMARLKEVAGG